MARLEDTPDRLRADIDAGRTGDKIAFPDPAAAPLGTDDEAGGTPASGARMAMARDAGVRRPRSGPATNPPGGGPAASDERPRTLTGESDDIPTWMAAPTTLIAFGLIVGAVLVSLVASTLL